MKNNKIYITGDVHGEFRTLLWIITQKEKFSNCNIIVAGDVGVGFYKHNYYIDTFKAMNKKISNLNVHLYLVRGNHDNPDYFNNTPEDLSNFSHIHFIRDYTVLHIGNHNILCVGGASSVDKKFRTKDVNWWEFENVLPYHKLECKDIDIVVTHCAPMFCPPRYERISWMDDDLYERGMNDRILLANLYFDLLRNNCSVKYWFYGHYHNHYISDLENSIKDFTDYSISLCKNGTVLPEREDISTNKGICTFIGLDMLVNNSWDCFKLL